MKFTYVHVGFYHAESPLTGDEYVTRTRPKNDGWMAIASSEGIVIATGLTRRAAIEACEKYDRSLHNHIN